MNATPSEMRTPLPFFKQQSVRIAPTVRMMKNQDGAVLLEIKSGLMFSLNQMSAEIWEQLSKGVSVEQIAEQLVTSYGISREMALADVEAFVTQLKDEGLMKMEASQRNGTLASKLRDLWNRLTNAS